MFLVLQFPWLHSLEEVLYFISLFPPSPMPEMQEGKATVPGAYDMENRHRGQLSIRLSCFLSCLDSDEEE